MTTASTTLCPVCGLDLGFQPWKGDSASHEICPCCGIHFGYDDELGGDTNERPRLYQRWRERWVIDCMQWWSKGQRPPSGWDPRKQVERIATLKLTAQEVLARYNDEGLPDFAGMELTDVNQVGSSGGRPIHVASFRGNFLEMQALIDAGADINVAGDMGSTPLHDAALGGHVEAVRLLLRHGADGTKIDEFGRTPLNVAERNGFPEIIDVLSGRKA